MSYHFLVHDRLSGVPAPVGDNDAFIHLNLKFQKPWTLVNHSSSLFEFTHPIFDKQEGIGGIDLKLIPGGIHYATNLIDLQSKWVMALIANHQWKDDADMVRQVQQFGHYFSNMLQMQFR